MFSALSVVPHLLAVVGLAVFVYRSSAGETSHDDYGGWDPATAWTGARASVVWAPARRCHLG